MNRLKSPCPLGAVIPTREVVWEESGTVKSASARSAAVESFTAYPFGPGASPRVFRTPVLHVNSGRRKELWTCYIEETTGRMDSYVSGGY